MSDEEKMNFISADFYRQNNIRPPTRGAVLVFLPGFLEIDTLFKALSEMSIVKAGYVS